MTGVCYHMLTNIEGRLSECTVDKNELSAAHLFIKDCFKNIPDDSVHTEADLGQLEILIAEKADAITFEDDPRCLCNDVAVIEMEMKLMEEERGENFLEVYDEIEWHLNEEVKELNTFLSQLEQNKLESKKSYEQALKKYEEDSENICIATLKVIEELKNFSGKIMLDQKLCESPLTALKEKFDCFLETFNFHLRNHFLEAANTNVAERCKKISAELRILEKRFSATLFENCILQCLLKGQEAAFSHITARTDAVGKDMKTSLKMNIQNEMAASKNIKTAEDIISDLKTELLSLSHIFADVQKLKHIFTMCNSKYNRVNYWLLQTEKWTNCIKSEKKLIADVLHVLDSEEEEASKVLCFLKDLETCLQREHDSAVCRTALMQTQLQNPIENTILYSILVNIIGQFSADKGTTTKLSFSQLEEAVINIKKMNAWKQNIFLQSFKDKRRILFENDYFFKLINDIRKKSVLNYPQINRESYEQRLSGSEKAVCAINQDFIEKQNTLSTNYFMKHRRLLWVYILCNEEKLAEVLSRVNEYLSDV